MNAENCGNGEQSSNLKKQLPTLNTDIWFYIGDYLDVIILLRLCITSHLIHIAFNKVITQRDKLQLLQEHGLVINMFTQVFKVKCDHDTLSLFKSFSIKKQSSNPAVSYTRAGSNNDSIKVICAYNDYVYTIWYHNRGTFTYKSIECIKALQMHHDIIGRFITDFTDIGIINKNTRLLLNPQSYIFNIRIHKSFAKFLTVVKPFTHSRKYIFDEFIFYTHSVNENMIVSISARQVDSFIAVYKQLFVLSK